MESTINPSPVLKYPYAHLRPAPDVSDPRRRKLETTVQSLITRIKERMQSLVGFEETRQLRFLLDELKKFDGNHDGFLTPEEFASFLMTLNYIGRNPDIDMLFCMFDDDLLGLVEYKEFAKCIYGKGKFPLLNADSKVVMQEIRDILVATDLHAPILFAQEMLEMSKMCDDKGSFTDKEFTEIIQARLGPVMSSLPRPRRLQFLNYFHFHQEAKVSANFLLRSDHHYT
jgi:Ca2+-binding EF-hand superfamily protein